MNIENKTVLITGANRGIGQALQQRLAGFHLSFVAERQPIVHAGGHGRPIREYARRVRMYMYV